MMCVCGCARERERAAKEARGKLRKEGEGEIESGSVERLWNWVPFLILFRRCVLYACIVCMYTCIVCMYTCIHVYMHVRMHVRMHACMYACMHIHTRHVMRFVPRRSKGENVLMSAPAYSEPGCACTKSAALKDMCHATKDMWHATKLS